MTDFLVTKLRESFVSNISVPMSIPEKRELQVASAIGDFLFDQDLLEKTSGQVKEDAIISSNVYPISTLPEHLHSTLLRYAKTT